MYLKERLVRLISRFAPYRRPFLVTLGWGISFGAITLWAIFQGLLLPTFKGAPPPNGPLTETQRLTLYYSAVVGLSILSGIIIANLGRTIGSFIGSYGLGSLIIFVVLSDPGLSASELKSLNLLLTREALTTVAIDLTFRVVFPFLPFALLFGGILGTALEELYLH